MGHVVFGAPRVECFALLERLRRELLRRGHRTSVLCLDRVRFTFWREQFAGVHFVPPGAPDAAAEGFAELARPAGRGAAAAARRLARLAPGLRLWCERERPDLVLLPGERSADAALVQSVARATGSRVLWAGDGILPHTLQVDEQGLDGDASCRRWPAAAYRVVRTDRALLDASLANVLAGVEPIGLPRARILVPALRRRLADAAACALGGDLRSALAAVPGWRAALPAPAFARAPDDAGWTAPRQPFVALLLQSAADARLCLDAERPPGAGELIAAACAAVDRLDAGLSLLVVLPDGARPKDARWRRRAGPTAGRVQLAPATAGAVAAASAVATITVNHPLASVALLAGTPVVHLGRALWGLAGVTTATGLPGLGDALAQALRRDRPALRRRFLTWLLRHGHVWCSPTAPSHNGMAGLVQAVERRLGAAAQPVPYRAGPAWPLAAEAQEPLGR